MTIICCKGWFHCLKSESKGRFPVNNILMFGSAWCLVMGQIQFSLIKKIKIGRPEHLLHTSDNITFLPYPHSPQFVRHMCIAPKRYINTEICLWNIHNSNLKSRYLRHTWLGSGHHDYVLSHKKHTKTTIQCHRTVM